MKKIAFILFILLVARTAVAGTETYSSRKEGSDLVVSSTVPLFSLFDGQYFTMATTNWSSSFANRSVKNVLRLGINPDVAQTDDLSGSMTFKIKMWKWVSGSFVDTTEINRTLALNYSHANPLTVLTDEIASYNFSGAYRVEVYLTAITNTSGFNVKELFVQSEIQVERIYALDANAVTGMDIEPVVGSPYYEFQWNPKSGAEWYELEWVHVANTKLDGSAQTDLTQLKYNYYLNSTRIVVKGSSYRIPAIFDPGHLIFRVRPIGYTLTGQRKEGTWSVTAESGTIASHPSGARETVTGEYSEDLNWSHQVAYGDDGERFESVVFADGLGRPRQTVGHNTETQQAVVSNVYYDELGRPVISDLPTPVDGELLQHYPGFNQPEGAAVPFEVSQFDAVGSDICNPTGKEFSTTSGAGQYYSPSNPDQDGANKRIPDAEKYPYNRVVFENDFSGRVQKVSGYGDDLKTGSGKETFYSYPSANQDELNRLFGAEVGLASHYSKMVTVDANGQIYVQYADMAGRVVATYLAGQNPSSLDAIDGNGSVSYTVALLPQNKQHRNMNVPSATLTYHEFIYENGSYSFDYAMTPQQFRNACMADGICLDCVYDLSFRILDACDEVVFDTICPLLGADVDKICSTKVEIPYNTGTVPLSKGAYTFEKTLTINQEAVQDNWCYYIENSSCVEPIADVFNALYTAESFDQCEIDVEGMETEGGCAAYREAMLEDMMPGGQYATFTYTNGSYSYTDPASIFKTGNVVGILWSGVTYKDENGDPILVQNAAGSMVSPATLPAQEFIEKFDPSWALSLLPYHPEYCFLKVCEQHNSYASDMLATSTYSAACTAGLLNPITGYTLVSGCSTSNPDPFFTSVSGDDLADDMEAALDNYNYTNFSAWEMAIYQAYCNGTGDIATCVLNFDREKDKDCYMDLVWVTYRGMYLELRQQFIYQFQQDTCDNSHIGVSTNWTTKVPRWGNPAQFTDIDTDGAGPDTGNTPNQPYFEGLVQDACETSCTAYADEWIEQLSGCDFTGVNMTNLRTDLINLCMSGCDSEHLMGATTAPPGSTGDTTLRQVVLRYFDESNLCTDLLISNPGPYQSNEELEDMLTKPLDTCACDAILTAQWDVDNNNPNNFTLEEMLAANTGVLLQDANYLVCACQKLHAGTFDPNNPQWVAPTYPGLTITAELSCSAGGGCTDCGTVTRLVDGLHARFSEVANFETALNYGTILTNYLNNKLGFHLSYYDYADFIAKCNADAENPYCTVNPLAREWAAVMKLLTFRGQLLNGSGEPVNLLTDNIVYAEGELQQTFNGNQYWSSQTGNELTLHFGTTEDNCTIELTLPEAAGFDFSDIVSFGTIQPLTTSCPGMNNTFTVSVSYRDCGELSTAVLTGISNCLEVNECVCDTTGLRLCDELPHADRVCYQPRLDELYYNAEQQYLTAIEAMYEPFVAEFNTACAAAFDTEKLSYTGPRNAYQYTLFYYDQAGNLVKTIAPAGVNGSFNPAHVDEAREELHAPGTYPVNPIPVHTYQTTYAYNSYDQPVKTANPDQTGDTKYFYDRYGRLVASQNPVQADDKKYSYVLYDAQGRPVETGQIDREIPGGGGGSGYIIADLTESILKANDLGAGFRDWVYDGLRTEITYTAYDKPYKNTIAAKFATRSQQNLRLRIASVFYFETIASGASPSDTTNAYTTATHYSYDLHGNVIETLQDVPVLGPVQQDVKSTQYQFELISGNVKKVEYQKGKNDQTTHAYTYDQLNRLTEVRLSTDGGVNESREAHYYYFDYGPLARVEIGQHKVQANDYSYTINGWMKGMNSNTLDPTRDGGKDGSTGYSSGNTRAHRLIARDITGYTLGYFQGDYKSIGTTAFEASTATSNDMTNAIRNLYNGNIAHSVTAINGYEVQAGVYSYDQLQRLKKMRVFRNQNAILSSNTWTGSTEITDYYSDYTYDKNGNLQSLVRNGYAASGQLTMDNFAYSYTTNMNRLRRVTDGVNAGNYIEDIDNQTHVDNYTYDKLGQLIADSQEGMVLTWRKGDKKLFYQQNATVQVEYAYNPMGQRVLKIEKAVSGGGALPNATTTWEYTLYAYDANGQVMATYSALMPAVGAKTAKLEEQMIYGASRLGVKDDSRLVYMSTLSPAVVPIPEVKMNQLGQKRYELTNWLGNVNAVISDKRHATGEEVAYSNDFSSVNGWTGTGTATTSLVSQELRVSIGAQWQNVNTTITTVPGQAYRFYYDIKLNAQGNVNVFTRDVASGTNLNVTTITTNATGAFIEFLATGTSTLLAFESQPAGARLFYLDNIRVENKGNVIDFSAFGTLNGWSATGTATATLSSNTLKATIASQWQRVEKTVATLPGHTYRFYYNINLNAQGNVNVFTRDVASGTNLNVTLITTSTPAASWPYIEFTATGSSTLFAFESLPAGARIFYVDNASVVDMAYSGGYEAVVLMKADYYPFGMTMPGRNNNYIGENYRYGYNGMESDNELKGNGNSYTTEFRQYDPRIGRWLSLDPLMSIQPWQSPYQAFNNNPIFFVDPLGLIGGPAANSKLDGAVQKYHVEQKFSTTEFERKLPSSGIDVGTTFEFDFAPTTGKTYSPGDRMRMSYTYAGNGVWNKFEQIRGENKVPAEQIKGNSSISGMDVANAWLGPSTGGNTVASNGGAGSASAQSNDKRGAGVTEGSQNSLLTDTKTKIAADKGLKNQAKGIVPDPLNTAGNAVDMGSTIVGASADLTEAELKAASLTDEAATFTKISKGARLLGTAASAVTIADNVYKAYEAVQNGNSYEATKYSTKAAVAAIALACNFVPGIGTGVGLAIFAVATIIEWGW